MTISSSWGARKIQRFLSRPFHVAEQFTGFGNTWLADTIRGFQEIVDGKHDDMPEQAFYIRAPLKTCRSAPKP